MIGNTKQQQIIELHNLGLSNRKIAERLNISNLTVAKYIKLGVQDTRPKNFIDMTNWVMSKHGVPDSRITVKEYLGQQIWKCKCECGMIFTANAQNIRRGLTKSCGCLQKEKASKANTKNLVGMRFGKLTVIELLEQSNAHGERLYKCKCDCGNNCIVASGKLANGDTKSCGCLVSKGEAEIELWLNNHQIKYETQKTYPNLKYKGLLRFDFYLPDYNYLIEYQGIQHIQNKKNFGEIQRNITDKLKREYCQNNNIQLYEIWYNENINKKLMDILNI